MTCAGGTGCACDCCTGIEARTPRPVGNPPAKSALAYRAGTHPDFLSAMTAHLATVTVPVEEFGGSAGLAGTLVRGAVRPPGGATERPLAALRARGAGDFVPGLIDAWAAVLDVLTFYQERAANEGFLRTATELRSVRELARLVGYAPRPGVAATAHVAYDVDATSPVRIPAGSRVQSVPVAGQTPQTFETTADLVARDRWSKLVPRKARPQVFEPGQTAAGRRVWFAGLGTRLNPNDPLLLVFDAARGEPFRVKSVDPDNPAQLTRVVLQDFRTEAVLGDATAAVRAAARMYDRATATFADAELARRADTGGGDTPAVVTDALVAYRAKLKPGAELKALVEAIGTDALLVFEELAKALGGKLSDDAALRAAGFVSAADARRFIADLRNLIARMEAVREFLTVQRAAARAAGLGGLRHESGFEPPDPHRDDFRALAGRWQPDAIRTLSGLALGNLLHDTRTFLLGRVSDADRPGFNKALSAVADELNELIRAVVRPVLTRFLRAAQSGLPVDTALGFDVVMLLGRVRTFAAPPVTADLGVLQKLAAAELDRAVERVEAYGRVDEVRALVADTVAFRAVADALPVPFKDDPVAKAYLGKVEAFHEFVKAAAAALKRVDDLTPFATVPPTAAAVTATRKVLIGPDDTSGLAAELKALPLNFDLLGTLVEKLGHNLNKDFREEAGRHLAAALEARDGLTADLTAYREALGGLDQAVTDGALVALLETGTDKPGLVAALDKLLVAPRGFQPPRLLDFQPTRAGFGLALLVEYLKKVKTALTADILSDVGLRDVFFREVERGRPSVDGFVGWRKLVEKVFEDVVTGLSPAGTTAALNAAAAAVPAGSVLRPTTDAVTTFLKGLVVPGGAGPTREHLFVLRAFWTEVVSPRMARYDDGLAALLAETPAGLTPTGRFVRAFQQGTEPTELVRQLNRGVWVLRQQQRLAAAGTYPRVRPWLDELTATLDGIVSDLTIKEPPPTGGPDEPTDAALVPTDPLAALRGDRIRRATDLDADITVRTAVVAGAAADAYADLAPQLAQVADPAAGRGVYAALANARFVRRERFQGVHVLRAKASVFGHNATADGPLATAALKDTVEFTVAAIGLPSPDFANATVDVEVTRSGFNPSPVTRLAFGTPADLAGLGVLVLATVGPGEAGPRSVLEVAVTGAVNRSLRLEYPRLASGHLVVERADLPVGQKRQFRRGLQEHDLNLQAAAADGSRATLNVLTNEFESGTVLPRNVLTLDGTYDKVTPGSFVVVERAGTPKTGFALDNPLVARVEAVESVTPAEYGLAGLKATRLTLDRPWLDLTDATLADVRGVTVYLQSEPLELAGEPYDADVGPVFENDPAATEIELDEVYDGLPAGRVLVVAGERTDTPGTSGVKDAQELFLDRADQVVDAAGSRGQGWPHTLLRLRKPLTASYQRGTVAIHGNVVVADHGETKSEVLGSGVAAAASQRFTLKQLPLTHVAAVTPAGAADTLKVRVNGVLWDRADRPAGLTPADRRYTLRQGPDGKWVVVFGDGTHGSRLPTGAENVRAVYRVGVGAAGNVAAGALSQVLTRPLGVRGATNPRPAAGGADPEGVGAVRRNAPVGAVALGRLVSVADYEDFARGFAGVARAVAVPFPVGGRRGVHVTVAGPDGAKIDRPDPLYRNLLRALKAHGDPTAGVRLDPRELRFLTLAVGLRVAARYEYAPVEAVVRARLLAALGFEARDFGRPVFLSDVVAVAHAVPGVDAVTVTRFALIDEPTDLTVLTTRLRDIAKAEADHVRPEQRLTVRPARLENGVVKAAQLAFLPAAPAELLTLTEWTA